MEFLTWVYIQFVLSVTPNVTYFKLKLIVMLCLIMVYNVYLALTLFTSASALVIYVSKLPLGARSIRACSISKLRKWIRC